MATTAPVIVDLGKDSRGGPQPSHVATKYRLSTSSVPAQIVLALDTCFLPSSAYSIQKSKRFLLASACIEKAYSKIQALGLGSD